MGQDNYIGLAFLPGMLSSENGEFFSLSEEIRAGVERRREEIHSEEDLERVIHEFKLKQ